MSTESADRCPECGRAVADRSLPKPDRPLHWRVMSPAVVAIAIAIGSSAHGGEVHVRLRDAKHAFPRSAAHARRRGKRCRRRSREGRHLADRLHSSLALAAPRKKWRSLYFRSLLEAQNRSHDIVQVRLAWCVVHALRTCSLSERRDQDWLSAIENRSRPSTERGQYLLSRQARSATASKVELESKHELERSVSPSC